MAYPIGIPSCILIGVVFAFAWHYVCFPVILMALDANFNHFTILRDILIGVAQTVSVHAVFLVKKVTYVQQNHESKMN